MSVHQLLNPQTGSLQRRITTQVECLNNLPKTVLSDVLDHHILVSSAPVGGRKSRDVVLLGPFKGALTIYLYVNDGHIFV